MERTGAMMDANASEASLHAFGEEEATIIGSPKRTISQSSQSFEYNPRNDLNDGSSGVNKRCY